MSKKLQVFRKVSLLLGIVTLMLGLVPLTSLSGGVIFADDSPPAQENSGKEKNQEADPPASLPENNEAGEQDEEVEELEQPEELEDLEQPEELEDLEQPEQLNETEEEFMLFSLLSSTGPTDEDPDDLGLPDLGPSGFYGSECEKPENAGVCEKNEDGNEVKDGGTFNPSIGSPTVVVIKAGPNEFIFSPNGPDCNLTTGGDPYCVTFGDNGEVTVEVNPCYSLVGAQQQCKPANDISNIQFWKPGDECECEGLGLLALNGGCECPDDEIYGCTEREATNFNPEATVNDQSCEYEDPEDPEDPGGGGQSGGGGGTTSLSVPPAGADPVLIPVTGADQLAELQLVLRSLGMAFVGASVLSGGLQRKIRN